MSRPPCREAFGLLVLAALLAPLAAGRPICRPPRRREVVVERGFVADPVALIQRVEVVAVTPARRFVVFEDEPARYLSRRLRTASAPTGPSAYAIFRAGSRYNRLEPSAAAPALPLLRRPPAAPTAAPPVRTVIIDKEAAKDDVKAQRRAAHGNPGQRLRHGI